MQIPIKNVKRDVMALYGVPEKVRYCTRCTLSNQRPRLSFDSAGVCSACRYWDKKNYEIDWEVRKASLVNLLNKHRKTNGDFDVVVPCSGGKDSAFVAHKLKTEFGMNPLLVTWSPLMPTEIGRKNLRSLIESGFSHIQGTLSPVAGGRLTKLALAEIGYPFLPFVYGQFNFPLQVSVRWNIPLVFYGENGEVEYGGDMTHADSPLRPIQNDSRNLFSQMRPSDWSQYGLEKAETRFLEPPSQTELDSAGTEVHWFGYYQKWDPQENYYYATSNTGFSPNPQRSEGTYSKYASIDDKVDGFHYYLAYIKFGHGRATYDTAQEIRAGKITREEGVALVHKYDGEFPKQHFAEFLEFTGVTEEEFFEFIDSWRSEHLWARKSNGEWALKSVVQ